MARPLPPPPLNGHAISGVFFLFFFAASLIKQILMVVPLRGGRYYWFVTIFSAIKKITLISLVTTLFSRLCPVQLLLIPAQHYVPADHLLIPADHFINVCIYVVFC